MIYELRQTEKAAALFEGWQETLIWSCLQGVMGRIYADDLENPASALALLGDFCFFAGEPKKEVALYKPGQRLHKFMIMIPRNREWGDLIEDCYGKNVRKTVRYAIKKEPDIFDREKLREAVEGLPDGYTLKMID